MFNFLSILLSISALHANKEEVAKVSEAMGHLIGKNLQTLGLPLDIEALVKGMQDEASGKSSPLADEDYEKAMAKLQEESHEIAAIKNLQEAKEFLEKNGKQEGVITVEKGKLQYRVLKQAPSDAPVVQSYNSPLIRYQVKALNGESFQSDTEEELLVLDEAIIGLKEGIVGMKEGESRVLYIHPELGYGKESYVPNALLLFEVEVVKADAGPQAQALSDIEKLPVPTSNEL